MTWHHPGLDFCRPLVNHGHLVNEPLRVFPHTLVAATGIILSTISPANAVFDDSTVAPTTETSSLSSTSSEKDEDFIAGVIVTAAVGGLIAGGVNWAVQQRLIPNPLPGVIPGPPALRQTFPAPAPAPAPRQVAPAPAPTPAARSCRNCTDAWNTIGRSIYRGDPGYASHLDRDGDGVGCESRPR